MLGKNAPRADGTVPSAWDVEPGWYVLRIAPVDNAVGILDLTFGQSGLDASEPSPSPPRTLIQLGVYDFEKDAYYQVFTNAAPRLITGPVVRALPVAPRQLPYFAGTTYFELDRTSQYWAALARSGGIAIHVTGEVPGLELECWAIRS